MKECIEKEKYLWENGYWTKAESVVVESEARRADRFYSDLTEWLWKENTNTIINSLDSLAADLLK